MRFKMIYSNTKDAKSRNVNLKCVTYALPIPLPLRGWTTRNVGHFYFVTLLLNEFIKVHKSIRFQK